LNTDAFLNTTFPEIVSLDLAYAECEQLAGRDKPHLFAAALLFERPEVRRAFVATYASMRLIDDAVDGIPNRASLSADRRQDELARVNAWLELVKAAQHGEGRTGATWAALADTFARFDFPIDPWTDLAKAMSSDVMSSSFRTWEELRHYMQGASVAPAVVFMYLVLMRPDSSGIFRTAWQYEQVLSATEDLAVFCYCVHILRDVATDLSLGESGLIYLPEDDLKRFGMSGAHLYDMRDRRRAAPSYRDLAHFEAARAREHLGRGRSHMMDVVAVAEPAHSRALVTLVDTYERILNELQDCDFDVFAAAGTV
jgi:phytoene synthase